MSVSGSVQRIIELLGSGSAGGQDRRCWGVARRSARSAAVRSNAAASTPAACELGGVLRCRPCIRSGIATSSSRAGVARVLLAVLPTVNDVLSPCPRRRRRDRRGRASWRHGAGTVPRAARGARSVVVESEVPAGYRRDLHRSVPGHQKSSRNPSRSVSDLARRGRLCGIPGGRERVYGPLPIRGCRTVCGAREPGDDDARGLSALPAAGLVRRRRRGGPSGMVCRTATPTSTRRSEVGDLPPIVEHK